MKAIITNESKEQEELSIAIEFAIENGSEVTPFPNLQALVDKSIPMKPTYPKEYPVPTCAVCGSNLGDNKFCRECGREIDWSDK
jgi:hypothetical protein